MYEKFLKKLKIWFECARGYSIILTVLALAVAFACGVKAGGNIWLGILCALGIEFGHIATNLIDDYFDYKIINSDKNYTNTVQKGKCRLLFDGTVSLKALLTAIIIICALAFLIGVFLFLADRPNVVWLMAIGGVAILFYQKFSLVGLSELVVGIVYGPLLFEGMYYVMTGEFSLEVLFISLVNVMFSEQFLFTHTLLDFDGDMISHKKTLVCRIGDKKKCLKVLSGFFTVGYLILLGLAIYWGNPIYLLGFLTLPYVMWLFRELKAFNRDKTVLPEINKWNFPLDNWEQIQKDGTVSFYYRLLLSRNIMVYMSVLQIIIIMGL
ncbi:prenyltransferase [bacterium]|nr:prenyltransferase [bacterium]